MAVRFTSVLVLSFLFAFPATAQQSASLGPQIGFYKARDADQSSGLGGLSLRLRLSDGLGVEGSINYRKERYYDGHVSVNSWPVMVTSLFYIVPVAYGAIGAGWYNSSVEYDIPEGYLGAPATITTEQQQEFGWHFGGGLELPVGSTARIIGDLKYVYLDYNFSKVPGSEGISSNFYVMTVGLLFDL